MEVQFYWTNQNNYVRNSSIINNVAKISDSLDNYLSVSHNYLNS